MCCNIVFPYYILIHLQNWSNIQNTRSDSQLISKDLGLDANSGLPSILCATSHWRKDLSSPFKKKQYGLGLWLRGKTLA